MEFSKRFKIEEVWPEELLAKKPEYRGKTLFDVLYKNGQIDKFPISDIEAGYANDESKAFGTTSTKACSKNTPPSAGAMAMISRRSISIMRCADCAGR
jgi:hypothetical protein